MGYFKRRKYQHLEDDQLISIYKENFSSDIIGILYQRYAHLVLGSCMKYLKNPQYAEDLTSKIFELLPDRIQRHNIQYFKSWLFTVTKNECLMEIRREKNKWNTLSPQYVQHIEDEEFYEDNEYSIKIMESHLSELNTEQRECIDLFYFKNKSYTEISELKGITVNQVKSYIQNGKRNLRIRMEKDPQFKQQEL